MATPAAILVAVVAVEALPVKAAVIVPAEKFPEPSRATTLEAVLAEVASTVAVTAAEPLKLVPVRYVPNVSAFATDPAEPEMLPVISAPSTVPQEGAAETAPPPVWIKYFLVVVMLPANLANVLAALAYKMSPVA